MVYFEGEGVDEWGRHRADQLLEFERTVRRLDDSIDRMHVACTNAAFPLQFGPANYEQTGATDAIIKIADDLVAPANVIDREDACSLKAMQRAVTLKRPARTGQSAHDSEIIEHYLGLCQYLRSNAFGDVCIFVTSNTADYCDGGVVLHPDLAGEFTAVNLAFATDLAWARAQLGI